MLETCGYVTKTTFYDDFTIADRFDAKAITRRPTIGV